jgi:hypothetical protein
VKHNPGTSRCRASRRGATNSLGAHRLGSEVTNHDARSPHGRRSWIRHARCRHVNGRVRCFERHEDHPAYGRGLENEPSCAGRNFRDWLRGILPDDFVVGFVPLAGRLVMHFKAWLAAIRPAETAKALEPNLSITRVEAHPSAERLGCLRVGQPRAPACLRVRCVVTRGDREQRHARHDRCPSVHGRDTTSNGPDRSTPSGRVAACSTVAPGRRDRVVVRLTLRPTPGLLV